MIKKVEKVITDYALLEGAMEITVALSGGADSVALLHILYSLKEKYGFSLYAAHFNHQIRGEEALRDQNFAKRLCDKLSVPIIIGTANVPAIAKENHESIELCARRLRYEFLENNSKGLIATAHTMSDNIETVLFNLARGTSIKGLCGIPIKRVRLIRPLINCTRAEIEEFCKENSLEYVTDSTNLCDDYTRNNIRHNVLPILKQINPSAEAAVFRMSRSFCEDADYFEKIVDKEFFENYKDQKLNISNFANLHPAVAKRILLRFLSQYFDTNIDNYHINELYVICQKGGKLSLFEGKTAFSDREFLTISTESEHLAPKFSYSVKISVEKVDFLKNFEKVNGLLLKNALDCDKIVGELRQGTKKAGDSISLYKRNGTKTLKKLYTEQKVPLSERKVLPVLYDDLGVVWVFGIGIARRCAVDGNTKSFYMINADKTKIGDEL